MFTGIIHNMGTLDDRADKPAGASMVVSCETLAGRLAAGDSIAVNGVCQTVERAEGTRFAFTAVGETLRRTTMPDWAPGRRVNLETAATPATALGGHLVQGHVDGVAEVVDLAETGGGDRMLRIALPEELAVYTVEKGSIAIDGVSLTIADLDGPIVAITIVPYTLQHTIIGEYAAGALVNIEVDIIAKYVRKYHELTKSS